MAKHRSSVFTVVREVLDDDTGGYTFSAVVGVYLTLQRAEEVSAGCLQTFLDAGVPKDRYWFNVEATTYYDE